MSKENCRDSWIGIWGLKHSFPGRFVKELQTTLLILQGSIAFKRSIKIPIKEQVSFWLFFYLLLFPYTEVFKEQIEQVCIPVGCVPPALVATTTCQYQGVRTIHPSGWRPSPGWRPPPSLDGEPPEGTWDQTARQEVKLEFVVFPIFQVLSNRVHERVQNPFRNDNIGSWALRREFTL